MGIYAIKPWFRGRLLGTAQRLARRGTTPDHVTAAGVCASLLGGGALALGRISAWWWLAVPVLIFLRIAANALDGLVAQEADLARPAGELFNEIADRLGDAALIGAIAAVPGVVPGLAFGALAAAGLASFVGITARAAGGTRRYDGPMGKPDRMFAVALAASVAPFVDHPRRVFTAALWLILGGALLTAANRYRKAHAELESSG